MWQKIETTGFKVQHFGNLNLVIFTYNSPETRSLHEAVAIKKTAHFGALTVFFPQKIASEVYLRSRPKFPKKLSYASIGDSKECFITEVTGRNSQKVLILTRVCSKAVKGQRTKS